MTNPNQISWEQLEALLHRVRRPGRYVGGEYNSVHKPWEQASTRVCLAFPDVYDLGMSNFALMILYDILNRQPNVLAERTYLPAPDMIAQMRQVAMPLYSLESRHHVAAFDLLAISTAYEHLYTNVLELLNLAELPIYSAERDERHPLVIGGGHGTFNPEPISDFFDAFVIGEGEDIIVEIVDTVREVRGQPRAAQLRALLQIPGLYVPTFYQTRDKATETSKTPRRGVGVVPTTPNAPKTVLKRLVGTLPTTPVAQLVPNIEIVHDRGVVEIQRGCTRGCRFCQAGCITRPVRDRSATEIENSIASILDATGYEEVALLSLSATDHPEIHPLLEALVNRFTSPPVTISLPSQRIESFSLTLADMLNRGRRSGFTFAPEAATDALRNRINKNIPTEDLMQVAEEVFERGWRTLKLYFMIGLPDETDADVEAIADIAHDVLRIGRRVLGRKATVHVSVSTFVPKPHTPFQWEPLADRETVERRQAYLKAHVRGRSMRLMWNSYTETQLETLLARGDRRLNAVIARAWELGARFDAWNEWQNFEAWEQAFADTELDLNSYLYRRRSEDEVFPWDHLSSGIEKHFLLEDARRSQRGELLPDCRETCHTCGILKTYAQERSAQWQCPPCQTLSPTETPAPTLTSAQPGNETPNGTLNHRITFAKRGPLAYVSVLELGQIWERSLRRAKLPLKYSQGFNPRPKIRLATALLVGCGADAEWLDIQLTEKRSAEDITRALEHKLPQGLEVVAVEDLAEDTPLIKEQDIMAAEYRIWVRDVSREDVAKAVSELLAQTTLPRPRRGRKHRGKTYDLRPLIEAMHVEDAPAPWIGVWMRLTARPGATGRPDEVLDALGLGDVPRRCTRLRLIKEGT